MNALQFWINFYLIFKIEQDKEIQDFIKFFKTHVYKIEETYPDPEIYEKLMKYPGVLQEVSEDQPIALINEEEDSVNEVNNEAFLIETDEDWSIDTINELMKDENNPDYSMTIDSSLLNK